MSVHGIALLSSLKSDALDLKLLRFPWGTGGEIKPFAEKDKTGISPGCACDAHDQIPFTKVEGSASSGLAMTGNW